MDKKYYLITTVRVTDREKLEKAYKATEFGRQIDYGRFNPEPHWIEAILHPLPGEVAIEPNDAGFEIVQWHYQETVQRRIKRA